MAEEDTNTGFGQELLTQELVTFERVHVNVSQSLIITTEDRMHLWLREVISKAKKQYEWITPASLVIAITLTLTTADFKNFLLPAETWHAIFVIVDIASFVWLFYSLWHIRKHVHIPDEIARLKTFSPANYSEKGVQEEKQ